MVRVCVLFELQNAFRFTLNTPYIIISAPPLPPPAHMHTLIHVCISLREFTKNGVCRLCASDRFALHLILAREKKIVDLVVVVCGFD